MSDASIVCFKFPAKYLEQVDAIARAELISRSDVLRRLLRAALKQKAVRS